MSATRPQIQHWVPQFYLRWFAEPESRVRGKHRVWVLDKEGQQTFKVAVAVKNFCGQRYLYTPEGEDGERDWAMESVLDKLETKAGALWPALIAGDADLADEEVRDLVAEFVASLHLRNVNVFNTIDRAMMLRDKLWGGPSPEALARRGPDRPDPTHSGRFFVHGLRDVPRIAALLKAKRWTVLHADEELLVTSDRPVMFSNKGKRGGPGQPDAVMMLPLSPSRLLVMDGLVEGRGNGHMAFSGTKFLSLNPSIEARALRFVFAHRPVHELMDASAADSGGEE